MSTSVGRNDLCPCGSGLKYKQCCEGKAIPQVRGRRGWILGAVALAAVALIVWGVMRSQSRPVAGRSLGTPPAGTGTAAGITPGTAAGITPGTTPMPTPGAVSPSPGVPAPPGVAAEPWAYDAATNRHFDPSHGHWHNGPPPPPESRGAANAMPAPGTSNSTLAAPGATPTGPAPAAWTYDPVKNQHWDPGHQHWHQGPPPAGAR